METTVNEISDGSSGTDSQIAGIARDLAVTTPGGGLSCRSRVI